MSEQLKRRDFESPKVEVFISGDIDRFTLGTPWGDVEAVKIPDEEMVLDPETTIHADLTEADDG